MSYVILILAMLVFAIEAVRAKRLISSTLWLAGVSALLSVTIYLLGAPQVAVIELSVGAGLVTVLFVFAIGVAGEDLRSLNPLVPKPVSWGLVGVAVLLLGWLILPTKLAQLPALEEPLPAVLWQQRGLDVLVQIVLIFSGVLGLLGLLAESKAPLDKPVAEEIAAQRDHELQVMEKKVLQQEREVV